MTTQAFAAHKVVATGLGFITPIGNDKDSVEESLREGRHGIEPVTFLNNPELAVKVAATIKGFEVGSPNWRQWRWPEHFTIPRETVRGLAPHGVYAFCALTQALADAGLAPADVANHDKTGLFCASAGSAMLLHHNIAQMRAVNGERGNPLGVVSSIAGTLNFNLAAHFHITGSVCGFVSACASSSHALGYACDEIGLGRMDRVIVIGAEELNADTLLPFMAMRALTSGSDPARASRPFDETRDGFVGAGGAVAMIVENAELAKKRGARIYGEIAGWGQAADGHSVAVSHPEGAGLARAIRNTIAHAGANAKDIDAINAHATSTPVGDRAEAIALNSVFSDTGSSPPVSSTKSLTGHPLSMSGVMEAGFCLLQISGGFIAGNANLRNPDEASSKLNLPRSTIEREVRTMLNNSSGFGGSNVCHLLRKWTG